MNEKNTDKPLTLDELNYLDAVDITLMEEKNADILCHKIYTILQPLTFIRYGSQEHRSANLILRAIKEILQAYFIERSKNDY